ncbi:hypothetical protein CACET_c27140 [Clostridium aceticum]|uniref:Uncharacterized protein n=1 Tax=Clostridium aceticum TaxID=84022 RepID=A0A0D8IBI2_9CLOT|nr:hypothetical protein [Clostridium aceticum]AKL96159.1 hypothetical protein CACET_c27140 [Clostridium aceticum]KJF26581.1 hypothetical protein TZ02_11945 [Clostridium aceticum]
MSEVPVYREPKVTYEIKSNQSKTRKYKVCFGEVDWGRNGETEYAVYTRVQLFKNGGWQYMNYPVHILVIPGKDGKSDFDNVMEKMDLIRKNFLA